MTNQVPSPNQNVQTVGATSQAVSILQVRLTADRSHLFTLGTANKHPVEEIMERLNSTSREVNVTNDVPYADSGISRGFLT